MEDVETKIEGYMVGETIKNKDLPLYRKVGSRHGVKISVIAREGELYTPPIVEYTGGPNP